MTTQDYVPMRRVPIGTRLIGTLKIDRVHLERVSLARHHPASEPKTSLGRSPKSLRRNERKACQNATRHACTAMNCSLIVERENSGLNVTTVKYGAIMNAPFIKGGPLFATCVPVLHWKRPPLKIFNECEVFHDTGALKMALVENVPFTGSTSLLYAIRLWEW